MMGYAILPHFAVVAMEIQFGGRFQVPILAPPSTTVSDMAMFGGGADGGRFRFLFSHLRRQR
jgi:hypothetical protein